MLSSTIREKQRLTPEGRTNREQKAEEENKERKEEEEEEEEISAFAR